MSKKIAIITDTGADNLDQLIKLDVDYVPLYITFDGENYQKQMIDIGINEFYNKLGATDFHPKTSLPSVMDYVDKFNEHLANDEDILYIALNSKFSGSYQASLSARDLILEENKDARIEIIDSLTVSFNQFCLVREAALMAKDNATMEEILDKLNKMIPINKLFVTVESLDSLKESGRLSNFSAALGGLLNIKPILRLEDGVLAPTAKVKGMNKALSGLIKDAKEFMGDDIDSYKIAILYGDSKDNSKAFEEMVTNELEFKDIEFCQLGVCIGLHAGPTLLGLGCVKYKF